MKNLHLLPTDKPSRLWLSTRKENYLIFDKFPRGGAEYVEPKNIYITSDEEIKEGDWVIDEDYDGFLVYKADRIFFEIGKEAKKIILTTDQDLINDGVQEVDEEFLEWFIKNPNCDFVRTLKVPYFDESSHSYVLIIPKEEDFELVSIGEKTIKLAIPMMQDKEEIKQETLEEAAERYSLELLEAKTIQPHEKTWIKSMFIHIAKWQQERMYSEEEIINALHSVELRDNKDYSKIYSGMKKCFEQYKKYGKI